MITLLVDASLQSGLGHLRRAQKLQKHLIRIGLESRLIAPHPLADINMDWLRDFRVSKSDRLIVDSYQASPDFYHHVISTARTLLIFEDFPHFDLPPKTFRINPAFRAENLYKNPSEHHFLGSDFMPFESAFKVSGKQLIPTIQTLFISFGGSAQSLGFYQQALERLQNMPYKLHICAPSEIAHALPYCPQAIYHESLDLPQIATLLKQSDVALLGGGGMLYESILALTPILAIEVAPNQRPQLEALSAIKACKRSTFQTLQDDLEALNLKARLAMQTAQKKLNIGNALESTLKAIFA
ncbi:hypothetical protein [Helicobacter cynogastricus]|uniref:hypothetical protein n=1 Tax=Helicobacter cynogastricus TaxID=329937 RepID=UPI000CF16C18|nr:hypothetical protein [Helicobacter cynogastricus]